MKYVFLYIGGKVPAEKREEVVNMWRDWPTKELVGVETGNGKNVSTSGVSDGGLDLRGVSVIEAATYDEALEIAKRCPSMPYGMNVAVFEEPVH